MKKLKESILISIEGIDGSGKTTLAQNLKEKFKDDDFPVLLTYEPGDTELGKHIRKILQERDFDMCGKSEFLLFAADRAQHFEDLIIPNLKKNMIIISDRMGDSSVVYQGYGRNVDIDMLKTINSWAMNNITPDIILYIKISSELAIERLKERESIPTIFEKEKSEFVEKLIKGYQDIFQNKKNVIVLDGKKSPSEIANEAYSRINQWIKNKRN